MAIGVKAVDFIFIFYNSLTNAFFTVTMLASWVLVDLIL